MRSHSRFNGTSLTRAMLTLCLIGATLSWVLAAFDVKGRAEKLLQVHTAQVN